MEIYQDRFYNSNLLRNLKITLFIIFTSSSEDNLDDIFKFNDYFDKGADLVIASRLISGGKFKSDSELNISSKLYLKSITFFKFFLQRKII